MPEITELQLQRLHSAAEEIQRVVNEIRTANEREVPERKVLVVRCGTLSASLAADDDIIVVGEPE